MTMFKLVIIAHGDNKDLHEEALAEVAKTVEEVTKAPVYRAWVEQTTQAASAERSWAESPFGGVEVGYDKP